MKLDNLWNEINKEKQPSEVSLNEPESYTSVVDQIIKPLALKIRKYLYICYALIATSLITTAILYDNSRAFAIMALTSLLLIGVTYNTFRTYYKLKKHSLQTSSSVRQLAGDVLKQMKSYLRMEIRLTYIITPISFALGLLLPSAIKGTSLIDKLVTHSGLLWFVLGGLTLVMIGVHYFVKWMARKFCKGDMKKLEEILIALDAE